MTEPILELIAARKALVGAILALMAAENDDREDLGIHWEKVARSALRLVLAEEKCVPAFSTRPSSSAR
jgi:hypothetical protein